MASGAPSGRHHRPSSGDPFSSGLVGLSFGSFKIGTFVAMFSSERQMDARSAPTETQNQDRRRKTRRQALDESAPLRPSVAHEALAARLIELARAASTSTSRGSNR